MCHGVNKNTKKRLETGDRDRGTPKLWNSEITPKLWDWDRGRGTMELLRNSSEITPKLGNRGIPKLLRNWGPWNYGITPKLLRNYGTGTVAVELWNYSEITPKLWD